MRKATGYSLQEAVRAAEADARNAGLDDYDDHHVRQATVHTRQDLVLVVAILSSIENVSRAAGRHEQTKIGCWCHVGFQG